MLTFAQERQVLALTMHIDQLPADLAEQRGRHPRPFIRATDRPLARTSRASTSRSGLITLQAVLGQQRRQTGAHRGSAGIRPRPRCAPCPQHDIAEVRSPSSRFTASMMIDLPAPVSPVSTLKPGAKGQVEPIDDGQVADTKFS